MKTLQLKTLPFLLVELPEGARDIKVFHDIGRPYISYFVGIETFRHYTDEDVEFIGKVSELPDQWFEQYVEPEKIFDYTKHLWNYVKEEYVPMCDTRESFYSLLEAKEQVYLNGNPLPHHGNFKVANRRDYLEMKRKWQEAQSRTFDPERTYIFTIKT